MSRPKGRALVSLLSLSHPCCDTKKDSLFLSLSFYLQENEISSLRQFSSLLIVHMILINNNFWWRGERFVKKKNVVFLNLFRKIAFDGSILHPIWFFENETKASVIAFDVDVFIFTSREWIRQQSSWLERGSLKFGFLIFFDSLWRREFSMSRALSPAIFAYLFRKHARGLWIRIISRWIEREWRSLKYLSRNLLLQNSLLQFLGIER